jgi:hypothetical protein
MLDTYYARALFLGLEYLYSPGIDLYRMNFSVPNMAQVSGTVPAQGTPVFMQTPWS